MKKITLILSALLFVGCEGKKELDSLDVQRFTYEGPRYILFTRWPGIQESYGGIEHNPDCECFQMKEFDMIQMAIIMTESRFDPTATGKAEDSGLYQMRPIYVKEVNRIAGTDYTIEDAYDVEKSVKMFSILQGYYNPEKDLDLAIYYHNKSPEYKRRVLQNYEFVKRYEQVRKVVSCNK